MGNALYTIKRMQPSLLLSAARKASSSYLWQYHLQDDGQRKWIGQKVRESVTFSKSKEIKAVAADNELGFEIIAVILISLTLVLAYIALLKRKD